jgi:CHRD domain
MKKKYLGILAIALLVGGALWAPAIAQDSDDPTVLEADLNGFAEVNSTTGAFGNGDLDGDGTSRIAFDSEAGRVCFQLRWSDIDEPFAAHIHSAAVGVNGPIVVDLLSNANQVRHENGSGGANGCATDVDSALIDAILANPAGYYTNVHNAAFPGGAIRGQEEQDEAGI